MPPRYTYWTIIAGGLPTAFRSAERDDLLPTFRRIVEKHPDAIMRWFARGKLWDSPEAARLDLERRRSSSSRPRSADSAGDGKPRQRSPGSARSGDWRPGGTHRDPRQDFKDQKRKRNQRIRELRTTRQRFRPREEEPRGTSSERSGAKPRSTNRRSPTSKVTPRRPSGQRDHRGRRNPRGPRS